MWSLYTEHANAERNHVMKLK